MFCDLRLLSSIKLFQCLGLVNVAFWRIWPKRSYLLQGIIVQPLAVWLGVFVRSLYDPGLPEGLLTDLRKLRSASTYPEG
jgi:hypothetical protein